MDTENKKPLTGAAKAAAERKAAKEAETANPETPEASEAPTPPEAPEAPLPDGSTSEETPPAGDPQGGDPSPEFRGKGADEIPATPPVAETQADTKNEDDPFVKLAKQYAKLYPKNKVFYITTDMQVFLEADKRLAAMHQKTLDPDAYITVKI